MRLRNPCKKCLESIFPIREFNQKCPQGKCSKKFDFDDTWDGISLICFLPLLIPYIIFDVIIMAIKSKYFGPRSSTE